MPPEYQYFSQMTERSPADHHPHNRRYHDLVGKTRRNVGHYDSAKVKKTSDEVQDNMRINYAIRDTSIELDNDPKIQALYPQKNRVYSNLVNTSPDRVEAA